MDRWAKYPPLSVGRSFHASCGFEGRYVYVLCGLIYFRDEYEATDEESGTTYMKVEHKWRVSNTIERLDGFKKLQPWIPIEIPQSPEF